MVSSKNFRLILFSFSILFLLISAVITINSYLDFRNGKGIYPEGSVISDVSISGLNHQQASEKLNQIFTSPVEMSIENARMQFLPDQLGFSPLVEGSLSLIEQQTRARSFWHYLWHTQTVTNPSVDLVYDFNKETLRILIEQEIIPRYNIDPIAPMPIIDTTNFTYGSSGRSIAIDEALTSIEKGLKSSTERKIALTVIETETTDIDFRNLEIFIQQIVYAEGYDGLIEIYIYDLGEEKELHIALNNNKPITGNIAYSAASTIKIPIMYSVLKRVDEPTPETALNLMERMIIYSENPPADSLMKNFIDPIRGPLEVTDDLQSIGYNNTFLAGYFEIGAPLLYLYKTPANTRQDIFIDPDIYNQTVPFEIGDFLRRIYYCANTKEDGNDINHLNESVSSDECQLMINLLRQNKIGLLMEAGLPPEASAAHKHGWTPELDGLLHSISDVGIISSPERDYVLVIFMHTEDQLIFDQGNRLFAKLSQTIYNAFNNNHQTYWWIDQ